MGKKTDVEVLCEDKQHKAFFRRYLKSVLHDSYYRRIYFYKYPAGKGSGEHSVQTKFKEAVKAYRKFHGQTKHALLVVIDADKSEVGDLFNQLFNSVKIKRQENEKIAVVIPRRNIDAWIFCLSKKPMEKVDEKKRYPKLDSERECKPAVDHLLEIRQRNWDLPDYAPDSLKRGCLELQRLDKHP